eukprot:5622874-Amphidinium_carterae.1
MKQKSPTPEVSDPTVERLQCYGAEQKVTDGTEDERTQHIHTSRWSYQRPRPAIRGKMRLPDVGKIWMERGRCSQQTRKARHPLTGRLWDGQ